MDDNDLGGALMAIILLLLCIFVAWGIKSELSDKKGTNTVDSTKNVTLDITDINGNSLLDELLDFEHTEEKLYFQPGSVYRTEGFQIQNQGVPVKYLMSVNDDHISDKENFREALDFWLTTDPDDFSSGERITSFQEDLKENETSKTYYVVVKMKESAGNEFQNKAFSGLGITVHAVEKLND